LKTVLKGTTKSTQVVFRRTEEEYTAKMLVAELAGEIGGGQHGIANAGARYPDRRQGRRWLHKRGSRKRMTFHRFYGIRKRSQCDFSAFNRRAKMIVSH
jgi:hypothetical protein